jgi:hypothetical protein
MAPQRYIHWRIQDHRPEGRFEKKGSPVSHKAALAPVWAKAGMRHVFKVAEVTVCAALTPEKSTGTLNFAGASALDSGGTRRSTPERRQ